MELSCDCGDVIRADDRPALIDAICRHALELHRVRLTLDVAARLVSDESDPLTDVPGVVSTTNGSDDAW